MPGFRPGKPRFFARRSTFVAFGPARQLVPYDVVDYDDLGGYDGVNTYTLDRPGLYYVTCGVDWLVHATASRSGINVRHAGVDLPGPRPASVAAALGVGYSTLVYGEAGDTVQISAIRHPTAASTIDPTGCWFGLTRVGPKNWT